MLISKATICILVGTTSFFAFESCKSSKPVSVPGKSVGTQEESVKGDPMTEMKISSPAFSKNESIPEKYTCEGEDTSVPLSWVGIPEEAESLVLIVDDPDAPDPKAPKMTWVHWILYNIPTNIGGLEEGTKELPTGTLEGVNDWKRKGYGGPCPPTGRHRYYHKLYALDIVLPDLNGPTKDKLLAAMEGHVIAQADIVGTYQKTR